jgi:hypothetical protein
LLLLLLLLLPCIVPVNILCAAFPFFVFASA